MKPHLKLLLLLLVTLGLFSPYLAFASDGRTLTVRVVNDTHYRLTFRNFYGLNPASVEVSRVALAPGDSVVFKVTPVDSKLSLNGSLEFTYGKLVAPLGIGLFDPTQIYPAPGKYFMSNSDPNIQLQVVKVIPNSSSAPYDLLHSRVSVRLTS